MDKKLNKSEIERIINNNVDPDIPFQEAIVGADNAAEKIINAIYEGKDKKKEYYKYLTKDMVDMLYASNKSTIIGIINHMIGEAQDCPVNSQSRCSWIGDTPMENMIWGNMSQGEVDVLNSNWGEDNEV